MIYDYVIAGSVCLTALAVSGVLLGLPIYRRYATLSWLEALEDDSRESG